jgi:hypothetical protein
MVDDGLDARLSDLETAAGDGPDWGPTIVFGDVDLPDDTSGLTIVFSDETVGGGSDG